MNGYLYMVSDEVQGVAIAARATYYLSYHNKYMGIFKLGLGYHEMHRKKYSKDGDY